MFIFNISTNAETRKYDFSTTNMELIKGVSEKVFISSDKKFKVGFNKIDGLDIRTKAFTADKEYVGLEILSLKEGEYKLNITDLVTKKSIGTLNIKVIDIKSLSSNKPEEKYRDAVFELHEKYNLKWSDDYDKLSEDEKEKYTNEIEALKEKFYPSKPQSNIRGKYDSLADEAGDVLVTLDAKTFWYPHGHAGIYSHNLGATIEALGREDTDFTMDNKTYKAGIRYLRGNINRYWIGSKRNKKTHCYEVKNATRRQNLNAATWASNKKTYYDDPKKGPTNIRINYHIHYCVVKKPGESECYNCVTLVENAWNAQGRPLREDWRNKRATLPEELFRSVDLKLVKVYKK